MFPNWTVDEADGSTRHVDSPREFVHALSTMINRLVHNDFAILHASEYIGDGREAAPGSWYHYIRVVAPYLTLWARYCPGLFSKPKAA
jgi:hypothetical protein